MKKLAVFISLIFVFVLLLCACNAKDLEGYDLGEELNGKIASVEIEKYPTVTTFVKGVPFSCEGGVIKVTLKKGGSVFVDMKAEMFDGVSALTVGKQTVIAKFFYKKKQYSLSFDIYVNEGMSVRFPVFETEFVYDGTEKTALKEGLGYIATGNKATDVGNYTAVASVDYKNGYVWEDGTFTDRTANWSISQAQAVITVDKDLNKVYDGQPASLTDEDISLFGDGRPSVKYYLFSDADNTSPLESAPTNVGRYKFVVTLEATENFKAASLTRSFFISEHASSLTAPENLSLSKVYDGGPVTVDLSSFEKVGDGNISLRFLLGDRSGTLAAPTDAGDYIAEVTVSPTINYGAYVWEKPFTISKFVNEITLLSEAGEKFYDGKDIGADFSLFTFNGQENVYISYVLDGKTVYSTKNAGTYTVIFMANGDKNHTADEKRMTYVVKKKPLTVSCEEAEIFYGDAVGNLELYYDGFVEGENQNVLKSPVNVSISYVQGDDAGEYPLTLSGGEADNYQIVYENGTLNVKKRVLTVTTNDFVINYGEERPSPAVFTINYSGFLTGEDETVLSKAPTTAYAYMLGYDAGEYPVIMSGGEADNYEFNYVNATLTVKKLKLSAFVQDTSITYGDELPAYFDIYYQGFLAGENRSNAVDTEAVGTVPNYRVGASAGTYDIELSGGVARNYYFEYNGGILTVKKAKATVRISDVYVDYRSEPKYNLYFESLKNGETGENFIQSAVFVCDYTSTSPVGSKYDINVEEFESANYEFAYVKGILTVTECRVDVIVSGFNGDHDGRSHGPTVIVSTLDGQKLELGDDYKAYYCLASEYDSDDPALAPWVELTATGDVLDTPFEDAGTYEIEIKLESDAFSTFYFDVIINIK